MTGPHNDFAPDPVRTARDYSAWGGGEACSKGSDRAWGGTLVAPTYGYGEGLAPGEGNSLCSGEGVCA